MDRWAKGLVSDMNKSLERAARRNPSRVPVQVEASTADGALARYEPIESSAYLAQVMLWLDAQTSGGAGIGQLEQAFPEGPVLLALQLEQRGLVKLLRAASGPMAMHLSDEGRVEVHRLKQLQQDRVARLRYTMDAFLRWLFNTAESPTDPSLFLATPTAYFAGAAVSGTDLHQALAYLAEHNLIKRIDTDPATVAITPEGVSCALSGGTVQDHTNAARTGTTYNNFLPNAKGVIIGEQQHFTQNNTDGVDPTLFVQLAGYVGQISPTLGMPEPERVELERVAQDLHDEATSENPEPGRLRQFTTQLKDKLLEAGTTMAAAMGVQMAEQALGALVQ
ncbi:hypothetical protein GCM10010272_64710 [Streptomyces lateritius]|nr:hypothetical protein GCM10010272_64710 [Streptomyces lateritius]